MRVRILTRKRKVKNVVEILLQTANWTLYYGPYEIWRVVNIFCDVFRNSVLSAISKIIKIQNSITQGVRDVSYTNSFHETSFS